MKTIQQISDKREELLAIVMIGLHRLESDKYLLLKEKSGIRSNWNLIKIRKLKYK